MSGATGAQCFVAGTRLATPDGERPIEGLQPGDTVLTASGPAIVRWVGRRRRLDLTAHPRPQEVQPIRIRAGAFGEAVPSRDLLLSPGHGVALDGALIPAVLLVNGGSIVQEAWARVEYWHVELAQHDLLLAEGLASESYIDCGERGSFEDQGALALHPDFGYAAAMAGYVAHEACCLPWLVAGPRLAAARAMVSRQARRGSLARVGSRLFARR